MKSNDRVFTKGRVLFACLFFGSLFYATPFMATYAIGKAAVKADTEKMESMMDKDSIRKEMREAIKSRLAEETKAMGMDLELIPKLLTAAVIDKSADKFTKPEAIMAIVTGEKIDEVSVAEGKEKKDQLQTYDASEKGYEDFSNFKITVPHVADNGEANPISLHLKRDSLVYWKIYKVTLPK